ncbi:unnamed protein product [Penicillium palitans]
MPLATTRQLLGVRHYMISQELARWYHQHHLHGRPAEHAGTLASPWEIATLYHLPGAGNTSCHLRVQQADHATCNNTPAPGSKTLYDLPGAGTMGLATWHTSCHLRVHQADHATCNDTPAPGTRGRYMISQELARWYNQHHLHGRPAEHAAGTLASPWEIATLYHLPGAGNMAHKLPSACSAGRPCHLQQQHASSWDQGTLHDLPGAGTMVQPTPSAWSAC